MYASSTSDIEVDPGFVEQVSKNESMRTDFPWDEALLGGRKVLPNRKKMVPYWTGRELYIKPKLLFF
jgi:hypothetical protein